MTRTVRNDITHKINRYKFKINLFKLLAIFLCSVIIVLISIILEERIYQQEAIESLQLQLEEANNKYKKHIESTVVIQDSLITALKNTGTVDTIPSVLKTNSTLESTILTHSFEDDNEDGLITATYIKKQIGESEYKIIPCNFIDHSNLIPYELDDMLDMILVEEGVRDVSVIKNLGDVIYDMEYKYNINALYLISIITYQSQYGTTSASRNYFNFINSRVTDTNRITDGVIELAEKIYNVTIKNNIYTYEDLAKIFVSNDEVDEWIIGLKAVKDRYVNIYLSIP